jgi:hypothetical protein
MSERDKDEPMPTGRRYRTVRGLIAGECLSEEVAKAFEEIQASGRPRDLVMGLSQTRSESKLLV